MQRISQYKIRTYPFKATIWLIIPFCVKIDKKRARARRGSERAPWGWGLIVDIYSQKALGNA